jgi:hypothetical protein
VTRHAPTVRAPVLALPEQQERQHHERDHEGARAAHGPTALPSLVTIRCRCVWAPR